MKELLQVSCSNILQCIANYQSDIKKLESEKDESCLQAAIKLWNILQLQFKKDERYSMKQFQEYAECQFAFSKKKINRYLDAAKIYEILVNTS